MIFQDFVHLKMSIRNLDFLELMAFGIEPQIH